MSIKEIYHGSPSIVQEPQIKIAKFNKDFYFGFYCTEKKQQAERWATRFDSKGYINVYDYSPNTNLNILHFEKMTEEWLDFIVSCRSGKSHNFDIVEGPMADDTIYNYVQSFIDGKISRTGFWELAKFKYPTHQISFHTTNALKTLTFKNAEVVNEKK